MNAGDVGRVREATDARVVVVHLEAINHCIEPRSTYRALDDVVVPDDGERWTDARHGPPRHPWPTARSVRLRRRSAEPNPMARGTVALRRTRPAAAFGAPTVLEGYPRLRDRRATGAGGPPARGQRGIGVTVDRDGVESPLARTPVRR